MNEDMSFRFCDHIYRFCMNISCVCVKIRECVWEHSEMKSERRSGVVVRFRITENSTLCRSIRCFRLVVESYTLLFWLQHLSFLLEKGICCKLWRQLCKNLPLDLFKNLIFYGYLMLQVDMDCTIVLKLQSSHGIISMIS